MKTYHLIAVIILCVIGSGISRAQADLAWFLDQTLAHDPGMKLPAYNRKVAELEALKIESRYDQPSISLTGGVLFAPFFGNNGQWVAFTPNPAEQAVGYDVNVSNGGQYSAQLNVSYPLLANREKAPLLREQQLLMEGEMNGEQLYRIALERQVTTDYLTALDLQLQRDNVLLVRETLARQVEMARELASRGIVRLTDVQLLAARLSATDFEAASLANQYREALQALLVRAGIPDTTSIRLESLGLEISVPADPSVFLMASTLDSLGADNNQSIVESRYLPSIQSFANTGLNAVSFRQMYRKAGVSAGVQVNWLLYDGHQRQINQEQVQVRQQAIGQQETFLRQQVAQNRANYRALLTAARANQQMLNNQLSHYSGILETYRREMAVGQVSVIDYLNVWTGYADLLRQQGALAIREQRLINELNYWNH